MLTFVLDAAVGLPVVMVAARSTYPSRKRVLHPPFWEHRRLRTFQGKRGFQKLIRALELLSSRSVDSVTLERADALHPVGPRGKCLRSLGRGTDADPQTQKSGKLRSLLPC